MTGPGWPRPWVARCVCSWEQRSATRAGAIVLGEAHRARNKGHLPAIAHEPDTIPADEGRVALILMFVILLVAAVALGVTNVVQHALGDLGRSGCASQPAEQHCGWGR